MIDIKQNKEDKPVVEIKPTEIDDIVNPQPTFVEDIFGKLKIVSAAPTNIPRNVSEQLAIYINGSTYRFYWYDGSGWRYATGT